MMGQVVTTITTQLTRATYAGSAFSSFGQRRFGPMTMAMLFVLILVRSEYSENS